MKLDPKSVQLLAAKGYRRISRKHKIIARIDRPDWLEVLAAYHAPWDPKDEGRQVVLTRSRAVLADTYRRIFSRDRVQLDGFSILHIPSSNMDAAGYIDQDTLEDQTDYSAFCEMALQKLGEARPDQA